MEGMMKSAEEIVRDLARMDPKHAYACGNITAAQEWVKDRTGLAHAPQGRVEDLGHHRADPLEESQREDGDDV